MATAQSRAFRERARLEADRYGPDPWIFVRELLQNSRDAGARSVSFEVSEDAGSNVCCRDDGEGMSFEHARRYLFSLYASSKENSKNQAGKFGVGFWSILRFDPTWITIRSCTRTGERWGIRLDGSLEHASHVAPLESPGTEITLERPGASDGRLEHRVFDAVLQSARYLHRRDDPDQALPVTVNGRSANADFALPAPSAAFRRGSVRGVVGLGPAPRVELFSRGLRVRAAASLEDLVAPAGRHTSRMRVQFPELPGGLAPQALLESDKLEVMLSRSDARDNRALARLVRLAQKELERLIDCQLSHARPLSLWRRAWEVVARQLQESLALRTALGAAFGAVIAVGVAWALWGDRILSPGPGTARPVHEISVAGPTPLPGPMPYQDLADRYRGPRVDVLTPGTAEPVPLRYSPTDRRLHIAALTFPRLAPDGAPLPTDRRSGLIPYVGAPCERDCVEIRLPTSAEPELVHIPVPTGHRIVEDSLLLNGQPVPLTATMDGHPALRFVAPFEGMMQYQTTPAPDPTAPAVLRPSEALPDELLGFAGGLRRQPVSARVQALVDRTLELVKYDRSHELARNHAAAQELGTGFIARTLELGAGDCDIQNGLLVALMHAADVEARLAVGYVGIDGRPYPWLHAWVEYRDEHGRWHVADASETAGATFGPGPFPAVPVAATDGTPAIAGPTRDPLEPAANVGAMTIEDSALHMPDLPADSSVQPDDRRDHRRNGALAWVRSIDDRWPWLVRGAPFAALALLGLGIASGRTRRAMKLDVGADLSRLLQGVLQQPGAFGNVQALFTRPLVPVLEGDAISLNRARQLAALGRLYRTHTQPLLARRAARAGARVVDVREPEGRTVADALGAVDLDRWAGWLDGSFGDALTLAVDRILWARGENLGLRIARSLPGEVAVLDLGPLGARLPGSRARRLVLVDERVPWLLRARAEFTTQPQAATFAVLDRIADRLDLSSNRRARLLSDQAKRAVLESFAR
jgi:hypothetical protein